MHAFGASSQPSVLDLNMSEPYPQDNDLDFFNASLPYAPGSTPADFLSTEDSGGEPGISQTDTFGSAASPNTKDPFLNRSLFRRANSRGLSAPSPNSPPTSSFHYSSSDSSGYKRKTSSDSSRSAHTGEVDNMMEDTDWKVEGILGDGDPYVPYSDSTINPSALEPDFDFNDKTMEDSFDFNSASGANSPMNFSVGLINVNSPEMQPMKHDTPRQSSSMVKPKFGHQAKMSQNSITKTMHGLTTGGSRETSPLSAMVTSQESSPPAWNPTASPTPSGGSDFVNGAMLNGPNYWPTGYEMNPHPHFTTHYQSNPATNNLSALSNSASPELGSWRSPTLSIHPLPLKSRVETQIPIKLTLFPMPRGITKLHLPTHTISKPKLLAKPAVEASSDVLELVTTLVCTSAMQNSEFRSRAFARAAVSTSSPPGSSSESPGDESLHEDDENRPLNGGEVKICGGCVTRERKRAARKKIKKIEDEELWHKEETRRVIVFNTQEVKDWQPPSSQAPSDATGDRKEPLIPDGAMQIDIPMRIACYCRHQNEKLGFQVIFTLKDSNGRLVAQNISSSIMITDDHKTHTMPALTTQTSNGSDGQMFSLSRSMFASDTPMEMPSLGPFRNSHSSSDLQTLQRKYQVMYQSNPTTTQPQQSQISSATMTPRNMSRQASPSGSNGPFSKKRKASGSGKIPTGLAMTKLETNQPITNQPTSSGASTAADAISSPFTPGLTNFQPQSDPQYGQSVQPIQPLFPQYPTGTSTPGYPEQPVSFGLRSQSMENLVAMQQMYSAPPSAHASRAPSPSGLLAGAQVYQQQQVHPQQLAQAIANANSAGFYSTSGPINSLQRSPTIHKMIPNEGPKAGGIEITCLGSGFFQGLEVMFGDIKATTTTYWGETSLVCLLPPAAVPGRVLVTLKHQQQLQPYPTPPLPKQQIFFNYVDDDEQQIIRTALQVLGHKMTGKSEDVRELARRIIGDGSNWGAPTNIPSSTGSQQQRTVLNPVAFGINVEATILRCLDLIDLDDSPRTPRFNFRRPSGQTMLHLACSLGLHRVAAALLARGANPDPRDKGGFTPMHFATMHGHSQIVRRLILYGADPTMRSLQGFTPAELSTNDDVFRATRQIEYHLRTRSDGLLRSRTSSATSLKSLWDPPALEGASNSATNRFSPSNEGSDNEDDGDDYSEDNNETQSEHSFYMRSRRASEQSPPVPSTESANLLALPAGSAGLVSPAAAMTAIRDQLSAQIQHLQNTMQQNLPNLTLPLMADYQAYLPNSPMVRRISALVPQKASRPGTADQPSKETDSRWWDLFSGSATAAPPAYEEIFPNADELDTKKSAAILAAAETAADNKCASMFDATANAAGSSTKTTGKLLNTLRIGDRLLITHQERDQLRTEHAEKVKRLRSDRNLFFVWIPLLILIILAMLYNNLPKNWAEASHYLKIFARPSLDYIVEA